MPRAGYFSGKSVYLAESRSYDDAVRIASPISAERFRRYGAFAAPVLSFAVWALHPIPWCFDCEYPNPWGHVDITNGWDFVLSIWWLVIASITAGVLRLKRSWIVPVGIVFAHVATQPFGGVAWGSLREIEGPVILILGLPLGMVCLLVGYAIGPIITELLHYIRRRAES